MAMTDVPASNLPSFPTPFIGRAHESAAIIQHLHATRLLTLLAEASLDTARETHDPARIGALLTLLAILATEQGDYPRAAAMHEEAIAIYRTLPHWFDVQAFEASLAEARRVLKSAVTPAARARAVQSLEVEQPDF